MTYKKKLILIFAILIFSIFSTNAIQTCSKESDEFILKCTIPEKYFTQDFTCLNKDCSIRLKNKYGNFLELYENNKLLTIILRNNIELNDISNDLQIINAICEEKFDKETLNEIQKELDSYSRHNWKFFSGEKLVIQPYSKDVEKKLLEKKEESKEEFEKCYEERVEKIGSWLINSKQKKPYCELQYENENECFITQVSYTKFISFLIFNPGKLTILYLLYLGISITVLYIIVKTIKDSKKRKNLKEIFKINKNKIIITAVLFVPALYFYGFLVKSLIDQSYHSPFLDPILGLLLSILGVLIIYFIASLIDHSHKKIKKKR